MQLVVLQLYTDALVNHDISSDVIQQHLSYKLH